MPTKILNPNHEATKDLGDIWPNIAVMIMQKHDLRSVIITAEDCAQYNSDEVCIAIHEDAEGLHLTLITMEEGEELAKKVGGLPN